MARIDDLLTKKEKEARVEHVKVSGYVPEELGQKIDVIVEEFNLDPDEFMEAICNDIAEKHYAKALAKKKEREAEEKKKADGKK